MIVLLMAWLSGAALEAPTTSVVIGAIGAVTVAVGTYLVARRQGSGKIATSDAATLWSESQAMRRELREEVVMLRQELAGTRVQLNDVMAEANTLRLEVQRLRREVADLRKGAHGEGVQ